MSAAEEANDASQTPTQVPNPRPARDAIKARVRSKSLDDPDLDQARVIARREAVELDGRAAFFWLRTLWSITIVVWISAFILFHVALTVAIGLGALDFTNHQWLIPLIVVENFLQIVGMGVIVVRFFHPGQAEKSGAAGRK